MNDDMQQQSTLSLKDRLEQDRLRAERERRLAQWRDAIEETIQEAQAEGKFDNLKGKGQPLAHLDNQHHEIAYQLLKDNDFTLGWISRRNEMQGQIDQFRVRLRAEVSRYQAAWQAATDRGRQQLLLYEWQKQIQTWETEIKTLNNKIRATNLNLPLENLHLITLGLDAELKRVDCGRELGHLSFG